jgi:hypothetical protein
MGLRMPVDFIKDVISSILLFAFFFGLCKLFFVFGSSDAGDLNREKEHQVPARLLDKDSFEPKNAWGELRLGVACVNGMYGPMIIDPPQQGDYRRFDLTSDQEEARSEHQ